MRDAQGIIGGSAGSGRRARLALALMCAVFGLLMSSGSAFALTERGHIFSPTLSFGGGEGSGAGQLKQPAGVAVNETSHDVYVVDAGNNRVDRFDREGHFISAWGFGVVDGKKELEICTTSCRAGLVASGKGELHGARSIAIDNSTSSQDPSRGDVYVEVMPFEFEENGHEVEREAAVIDKFTPEGKLVEHGGQINGWKEKGGSLEEFEEPFGIAVSPSGTLWVYNEEEVIGFTDGQPNKFLTLVELEMEGEPKPGLAVDSSGDFYVGTEVPSHSGAPTAVTEFNAVGEPLLETLLERKTTGVTYEAATGDILLDNGSEVSVVSAKHSLVQSFGDPEELGEGAGLAVDGTTGDVFVADDSSARIEAFVPEPPSGPTVEAAFATNVTAQSAELGATIDPHGADTHYTFRYSTGIVPAAGEVCTSPCVEAPLPAGDLGAGFVEVATPLQGLSGLASETRYHYRVWAQNETQEEGAPVLHAVESSERSFTTPYLVGSTLPDGRSWEQVTPQNKQGAALEAQSFEGGVIQASEDGGMITYIASGAISSTEGNPEPEGNRAPDFTQILSTRNEGAGWASTDIDTKHEKGEGLAPGNGPGYRFFSSDLMTSALETFGKEATERPPLTRAAAERTPYLRNDGKECRQLPAPESCFVPLVNSSNDPLGSYGGKARFVGASPDLSHVVLESSTALTAQAVPSAANLYEWSEGQLQLISVLPEGSPASHASLGFRSGEIRMVDHAVSDSGARVIFSTYPEGEPPKHLYMRDTEKDETVQLDSQEAGVTIPSSYHEPYSGYEHAYFQSATPDGSEVFFTDEWRLTTSSTAGPGKSDLYECRIVEDELTHKLGCKLTDLSVDANANESAAVQGVLGLGSDSSSTSVYFVANGALSPGSASDHCTAGRIRESKGEEGDEAVPLKPICNLYVSRYSKESKTWSLPKLIAGLSEEDEPDWLPGRPGHASQRGDLAQLTSRVSPSGGELTFMSDRPLTGYDTTDAISGRPAEEVYLYDANTERLVCASCNPTGKQPTGVLDEAAAGEGKGLLVDRPEVWVKRWLASNVPGWTSWEDNSAYYQSRYLSDEGRLFFNSAEGLVPQDQNHKEDVYEYEPVGVGGCTVASETYGEASGGCVALISSGTAQQESAFLDASATGNDVFFLTDSPLVAQDEDFELRRL